MQSIYDENRRKMAKEYSKKKLFYSLFDDQPLLEIKNISFQPFIIITLLLLLQMFNIIYITSVYTLILVFMFLVYIFSLIISYMQLKLDFNYELINTYRFKILKNIFKNFANIVIFRTILLMLLIYINQDLSVYMFLLVSIIFFSQSKTTSIYTSLKEKFIHDIKGSKIKKDFHMFKANINHSNKINAFYNPLLNSIVLHDTLINNFSFQEIKIVLSHEIGHLKTKKLLTKLHLNTYLMRFMGIIFAGFLLIGNNLTAYNGFYFLIIVYIINNLTNIYFNTNVKTLEKKADLFALRHTKDIKSYTSTFKKLAHFNLGLFEYPTFLERASNNHPSPKERIDYGIKYYQNVLRN